jgi:hypothetical protein
MFSIEISGVALATFCSGPVYESEFELELAVGQLSMMPAPGITLGVRVIRHTPEQPYEVIEEGVIRHGTAIGLSFGKSASA